MTMTRSNSRKPGLRSLQLYLLFGFVGLLVASWTCPQQLPSVDAAPPPPWAWQLLAVADDAVNAVELCMGKVFIGGAFRQVSFFNATLDYQTVNGIAMLVENGTKWLPLYDNDGAGPAFGINGTHYQGNSVMVMKCIQENQHIYVGGNFEYAGDRVTFTNGLAAYDLAYGSWESVGVLSDIFISVGHGCRGLCPPEVWVIEYMGGNQLIIGGRWIKAGTGVQNTSSVAWLNIASDIWNAFGGGIGADFYAGEENFQYPPLATSVAVDYDDQQVMVVGQFDYVTNFDGSMYYANGTALWEGIPGAYDWAAFSSGLFPCITNSESLQYFSIDKVAYAAGTWWIAGSFCYDRNPVNTAYRVAKLSTGEEYGGWQSVLEGVLNKYTTNDAQNEAAVLLFITYIKNNCNNLQDPDALMNEAASFASDMTNSLLPINIITEINSVLIEGRDIYISGSLYSGYNAPSGVVLCPDCITTCPTVD